jgi:hypothetical protein
VYAPYKELTSGVVDGAAASASAAAGGLYLQVYASYRLRRDLAEAAKPQPSTLEAALKVTADDLRQRQHRDTVAGSAAAAFKAPGKMAAAAAAEGGAATGTSSGSSKEEDSSSSSSSSSSGSGVVQLDEPDMRQAIAWQLCHRQMMHQQVEAAVSHFKQHSGADDVRDLQVRT